MRAVEEVALYAILLRETARNHHTGPNSLFDDLTEVRGEVNFALMLAHTNFTELDWELSEVLELHPTRVREIARALHAEHEQPLEAEALLHACGPRGQRTNAKWAEPFRPRWREVRAAIRAFEQEGIAVRFGDLDDLADHIYMAESGATREELEETFYEPVWDAALVLNS